MGPPISSPHGTELLLPAAAAGRGTHGLHRHCCSAAHSSSQGCTWWQGGTACQAHLYHTGLLVVHMQLPTLVRHQEKPHVMKLAAFIAPCHAGPGNPPGSRAPVQFWENHGTCTAGDGGRQPAPSCGASPSGTQVPAAAHTPLDSPWCRSRLTWLRSSPLHVALAGAAHYQATALVQAMSTLSNPTCCCHWQQWLCTMGGSVWGLSTPPSLPHTPQTPHTHIPPQLPTYTPPTCPIDPPHTPLQPHKVPSTHIPPIHYTHIPTHNHSSNPTHTQYTREGLYFWSYYSITSTQYTKHKS